MTKARGTHRRAGNKTQAAAKRRRQLDVPTPNEGRRWTVEDRRLFAQLWFDDVAPMVIAERLGRTYKAIDTLSWKMPAGYDGAEYVADPQATGAERYRREGKHWSDRDVAALRHGIEHTLEHAYIAAMLGRTVSAVQSRIEELQRKDGGFGL